MESFVSLSAVLLPALGHTWWARETAFNRPRGAYVDFPQTKGRSATTEDLKNSHMETGRRGGDVEWAGSTPTCGVVDKNQKISQLRRSPLMSEGSQHHISTLSSEFQGQEEGSP